jgi:hypothetical protein
MMRSTTELLEDFEPAFGFLNDVLALRSVAFLLHRVVHDDEPPCRDALPVHHDS